MGCENSSDMAEPKAENRTSKQKAIPKSEKALTKDKNSFGELLMAT
jgi:hypothetical protein